MDRYSAIKSYLAFSVVLALFIVFTSQQIESAAVHSKRSIVRQNLEESQCRSNAVCGWEVYDAHTRNLQYYVSSSCKCVAEETCIRIDDDISISAYVYRCRPRRNKKKTTARPANGGSSNNSNATS